MKKLIENKDYEGIRQALSDNPDLANEGIPYDSVNTTKANPLHRICDAVFVNKITDNEGVEIAKIFLEFGAKIDGEKLVEKKDTPLIAASSLHADQVAIFYLENRANIKHPGTHGGTALHWAAWCGRDKVLGRLVKEGAEINKLCIDFKATPLFWAVHGLNVYLGNGGDKNLLPNYLECVRILVQAGADKSIPNADGKTVFDLVKNGDLKMKEVLD